jgi:CRISPR-associated protein Cmr6
MTRATRTSLSGLSVGSSNHAGLALGALLSTHPTPTGQNDPHPYHRHADQVAQIVTPKAAYAPAFRRWQQAMSALEAVTFTATTRGPLVIGLGNASATEAGLTLHHTYGLPYLPGSALKGLARRAARACGILETDPAFQTLFGTSADAVDAAAAYPVFWDGWLDPECKQPLQLDVITVHHQTYYGSQGKEGQKEVWPTDFDDPNPVPFLSVPPSVTFHLAVGGSGGSEWAHLAAQLVHYGLTNLGLGGKTNAGYGGFTVVRSKSAAEELQDEVARARQDALDEEHRAEQERQNALIAQQKQEELNKQQQGAKAARYDKRIDDLKPGNVNVEVGNILQQTADLDPESRRAILAKLRTAIQGAPRLMDKALIRKIDAALGLIP